MTRQDFENKKEELQKQIGMGYEIVVGYFSEAEYKLGCYYNDEKGMWIMYQNHDRGLNYICLETPSEEEAFERLYSRIQFEIETIERGKRREAREKEQKNKSTER